MARIPPRCETSPTDWCELAYSILRTRLARYSSLGADSDCSSSTDSTSDWRVHDMQLSANGGLMVISGMDGRTRRTSIDLFRFNPDSGEEPEIIYSKEFSKYDQLGLSIRYVSFLGDDEAGLLVTCCRDQLESYSTERNTRLRVSKLYDVAQCMTARERLVYIVLSEWPVSSPRVVVFDDDLNLMKTITLRGYDWPEDITVIDSSRLLVCTTSGIAIMYSSSTGSPLVQYTKPHQISSASSITVSSEMALVLVSWENPAVITVHPLSDSHGGQILFQFSHDDPFRIRMNLNRLMVFSSMGELSVFDMRDILSYPRLKEVVSVMLAAGDWVWLAHSFRFLDRIDRTAPSKSLLALLEEGGIIQSSDIAQFIAALDRLNISKCLSAICKGYMKHRATESDRPPPHESLPGPSHRSPQLPSPTSNPRKRRSSSHEPIEQQGGGSEKRMMPSYHGAGQVFSPVGSYAHTFIPRTLGQLHPLATPPPPCVQFPNTRTTANASVVRYQSQLSPTDVNTGRIAGVAQPSQEQVNISRNSMPNMQGPCGGDVREPSVQWNNPYGPPRTSDNGILLQLIQTAANIRYPIGASSEASPSLFTSLNDSPNITCTGRHENPLPLTILTSSSAGSQGTAPIKDSTRQQIFRDRPSRNNVCGSSASGTPTWPVPPAVNPTRPTVSPGSITLQGCVSSQEAGTMSRSKAIQLLESTASLPPSHTDLALGSVRHGDRRQWTPQLPSNCTPRATATTHSFQQRPTTDCLQLDGLGCNIISTSVSPTARSVPLHVDSNHPDQAVGSEITPVASQQVERAGPSLDSRVSRSPILRSAASQEKHVSTVLNQQFLGEITEPNTHEITAVTRRQSETSSIDLGDARSPSPDRVGTAYHTLESASTTQHQVDIPRNPMPHAQESSDGDARQPVMGRSSTLGQQTSETDRNVHPRWPNVTDARSPEAGTSYLALLNDTSNGTGTGIHQNPPLLARTDPPDSALGITPTTAPRLLPTLTGTSNNVITSHENVALRLMLPSSVDLARLSQSLGQQLYFTLHLPPVEVEPPAAPLVLNRTPTSKQASDSTNIPGNILGRLEDQPSSTPHDPAKAITTSHSAPPTGILALDKDGYNTSSTDVAPSTVAESHPVDSTRPNSAEGFDIAPVATELTERAPPSSTAEISARVATATATMCPSAIFTRSKPAVGSNITPVATEQAETPPPSSATEISEPSTSFTQNRAAASEQLNVPLDSAVRENAQTPGSCLSNEMVNSIMNYMRRSLSQFIPSSSSSMSPTFSQSDDGVSRPGPSGVSPRGARDDGQAAANEQLLPSQQEALRQFTEHWESFSAVQRSKLQEYRGRRDDRDALVRTLVEFTFTDEERRTQNCQGKSGYQKLDAEKLDKIRRVTFHLCPIETSRATYLVEKKEWTRLQGEIDTANRHFRQELRRRENRN